MRTISVLAIIAAFIMLFGCGGGGGGGSDVTVTPEENPKLPVADAGLTQSVKEGELVTLDGSKSKDAGVEIVIFDWSQVGGTPSVSLSNSNAVSPTFVAPEITANSTALVFKLTVTDKKGEQSSQECTIVVNKKNKLPNAVVGPISTVTAGSTVTLDGTNSSDVDDGIASYTWVQTDGQPMVSLSNANTSKVTFVAPSSTTALTFELTVKDKSGQASTATCYVNVNSDTTPNQAPIANAGVNQTVVEGAVVTLDGSNSRDADGTIARYEWTQIEGSPSVVLQNSQSAKATFTAPNPGTSATTLTFQLMVVDNGGFKAKGTCIVNVVLTNTNQPPTVDAGAPQNVAEYSIVTLNGSATDDSGLKSYSWRQKSGPSVKLSDPTAARPTFTAPALGSAALEFELTVTDTGYLSATGECIVNVTRANIPTAYAGPDQSVEAGTVVTLDGSKSTDAPGGTITRYAWVQTGGSTVTLQNANSATCTFTAPDPGIGSATFTFQLTVTDNENIKSPMDECIITVTPININNPPTANAGADQSVEEGATVTLNGSASTDDAGIVSYSWRQLSGPAVTLTNSTSANPSITAPQVASSPVALEFELTVTDTGNLSSQDRCIIIVTGDNDPPTANAGLDQTGVEGATMTLSGSGSSDPDDGIRSYAWTQTGGPSVTLSNAAAANPTFTAPNLGLSGSALLTFHLTVTDNGGLMAGDACTVTIQRTAGHMAQDALFTAYAGIGYMQRDPLTDNEVLYNVMVDDINSLATQMVESTIANDPSWLPTTLYNYYWWGSSPTFVWNATGFRSTVTLNRGPSVSGSSWDECTFNLSIDFNANGYAYRTCRYTGTSGTPDVTATIKGYFRVTDILFFSSYETIFRSVDIQVSNALRAQYAGAAVTYNQWRIAYTVGHGSSDPISSYRQSGPVNVYMIPAARRASSGEQVDNRDYTLGGGFTINGNAYQFGTGFHYVQQPFTYLVNNVSTPRVLVGINGSLAVPGMTNPVSIQTPFDTVDPVGSSTIFKLGSSSGNNGIWEAGRMTMTGNFGGTTATQTATFTSGSSAFNGDLGAWSVNAWQDALATF